MILNSFALLLCCTVQIVLFDRPHHINACATMLFDCMLKLSIHVQCYQGREYILHDFTFLHVRGTNLHENRPDLECSYFGTAYILELINGMSYASLPQIFA